MENLICPICQKDDIKYTMGIPKGYVSTLAGYLRYIDEEGEEHHHDDNRRTTVVYCSNGHKFHYQYKNSCWCGWEGLQEEFKLIE